MKYLMIIVLTLGFSSIGRSVEQIPDKHPRVYLNARSIEELKKKIQSAEFLDSWKEIKKLDHPFARAFESLFTEDKEMATKAATDFLPYLQKCKDGRVPFNEMQLGACIYDWCYSQMSEGLKELYIKEFKRIAASHSPYYPAKKGYGALVGHNTEGWLLSDQLPAGLAIYDEDPTMYDSATVVFFEEFVPARNFYYQAHMHHQGDSYMGTRFIHDLFAAWLFDRIGMKPFNADMQYVPYQLIYNYRPDGQQMRSGDTFDDAGDDGGGKSKVVHRKALVLGFNGWLYDDPYQWDIFNKYTISGLEEVFIFIFQPLTDNIKPVSKMPLTKFFPHPMGEMIARTGWNMGVSSNDAIIQMRIGNYFFGNHQHKDFGTFQIYYKGPLAISSGTYQGENDKYGGPHWTNYYHQTISKNGLLIFDPSEEIYRGSINDGGQRWPNKGNDHPKTLDDLLDSGNGYKMGEVTAYSHGPDQIRPEFSYISGDITEAYSSAKADKVIRSMLAVNTGDKDFPALFFVFDKVNSTKESFKKSWLIHSIEEPVVAGNSFTISRAAEEYRGKGKYNGKLIGYTVLPENALVNKIGGEGKGFWIESSQTNYFTSKNDASEEGAWRIEVSPKTNQKEDVFFHAMAVTQADNEQPCAFEKIPSDKLKGVMAKGFGALFNPENKLNASLQFTLGKQLNGLFIEGLQPGNYKIIKDGSIIGYKMATDGAKCIYLQNIRAGNYKLKHTKNNQKLGF